MWKQQDNSLVSEFSFANFAEALVFVNKVGALAEAAQHHPDIALSWGKVVINLSTHSAGAVTDQDRALAKKIDDISD
jgi:4a-hydroxytetrahydrobiopterin dehydratase